MRYLILFLFPSIAFAVPVDILWDANPPEEKVINYKIYKNGLFLVDETTTQHSLNIAYDDCLSVSATNKAGEGATSSEICLPLPLPGQTRNLTLKYTDRNGNEVIISVPLPQ